ncbi:MAG: hypothetical protein AMXMBFR13_49840 [Phycisphaerae bacterium]
MTEGEAAAGVGTVGTGDITEAIIEYARRGWQAIPVRYRSKQPAINQWQDARLGVEELVQHCANGPLNLGVLLGEPSRNLLDVDLDDPVALSLADKFLPMTGAEFGHASKPRSHRLYKTDMATRIQKYQDGPEATLVELRGTGGHTVFPPSTHCSGEPIEWDDDGDPASVSLAELQRAVRNLAAATLLVRHYPQQGDRQDMILHLAGALLRDWKEPGRVEQFIGIVAEAAEDEERIDRIAAVHQTREKLEAGKKVTGWPNLAKLMGHELATRLSEWTTEQASVLEGQMKVLDAIPNAPVSAEMVVPSNWALTERGIERRNATRARGGEPEGPIAPTPVLITGRYRDRGDGSESLELCYPRDGQWKRIQVKREIVASTGKIVALAADGLPVTSSTAKAQVEYLAAFEAANIDLLPPTVVSNQFGWHGPSFLIGSQCVQTEHRSTNPVIFRGNDVGEDRLVAAYRPAGSLDQWVEAIQQLVEYPRAMFFLYAGFAAPLLKIIDGPNFLVESWCQTSTGKTTLLRIAASAWGNPDERRSDSILQSFGATRVHLERMAATNNDLPLFIDETQRGDPKVMLTMVYELAHGRGRGRGSLEGTRTTQTFRSVALLTGEQPITAFRVAGGTNARVLEIPGLPFGKTDEQTAKLVHHVNHVICDNYGHAGERFLKFLVERQSQWSHYRAAYRKMVSQYGDQAGSNSVMSRMGCYFAAVRLAAQLAHEALDLPWACADPIAALWEELAAGASEADKPKEALAYVYSWAQANRSSFIDGSGPNPAMGPYEGWAGRWDSCEEWEWVAFYTHRLKELLEKANYNPQAALSAWRDRGWLDCDKDGRRYEKKVTVNGEKPRMYVLKRSALEQA